MPNSQCIFSLPSIDNKPFELSFDNLRNNLMVIVILDLFLNVVCPYLRNLRYVQTAGQIGKHSGIENRMETYKKQ